VVAITGGASGIGRATALRCLDEGARVVVGDVNPAALAAVERDVADENGVAALVDQAVTAFGDLHGIFNNAGVPGAVGPLTELRVEDWDRTMAILLRGPFLGIKHAAQAMIERGHGGWVVSTSSIAGMIGGCGPVAYSTAKAGVINLTRAAAVELGPHHIRVNAVSPGLIVTPLVSGGDADAAASRFDSLQPLPGHGEASDVASLVVFLGSDDARFVTGQNFVVDGGITADLRVSARMRDGTVPPVPVGYNAGTTSTP
jgi:NAD(P)-dependent dehydrogenase (short-subunit alcohol dehydrogenase family)